ncbi:lipoprotein-attachment site-containing protein [Microbulbifer donghaiensis]|uniref:Lipoprotein-attachment site-containing protein n=1 Tax=Microbulbifer donghaiensis TaxID=494016 RepID=A0A1M5EQ42_9GAMM|nr:lipoprotein [Microbulbifer donghaiensis]SHF81287.1 lipoprotein-attachment site-containing protein [Microbulbifer donghaiensis]
MPKKFFLPCAVLLGAAGLISGCGQKGPLYLPQEPAAPAQPVTTMPAGPQSTTVEPASAPPAQTPEQAEQQQRRAPATEQTDAPAEPVYEK